MAEHQGKAAVEATVEGGSERDEPVELLSRLEEKNCELERDMRAAKSMRAPLSTPASVQDDMNTSVVDEGTGEDLVVVTQTEADTQKWDEWNEMMADIETAVKKKWKQLAALIRQGVPAPLRGLVWQHASKAISSPHRSQYVGLLEQEAPSDKIIRRDITRTFPLHEYFADSEGVGQESMYNVLKAYSLFDTEVSYCQGLPFVVGALVLQMPEEEAFCVLISLMYDLHMRELYKPGMSGLDCALFQLDRLLAEFLPALSNHFSLLGVRTSMFASQWFLTLFASTLPLPAVFRILDNFFADGHEVLFGVALGLLKVASPELLQMPFEEIMQYFKADVPARFGTPEAVAELLRLTHTFKVNRRKLAKLEREHQGLKAKGQEEESEIRRLQQENRALASRTKDLERENTLLADKLLKAQASAERVTTEAERLRSLLVDKGRALNALDMVITDLKGESRRAAEEQQSLVEQLASAKVRLADAEFSKAGQRQRNGAGLTMMSERPGDGEADVTSMSNNSTPKHQQMHHHRRTPSTSSLSHSTTVSPRPPSSTSTISTTSSASATVSATPTAATAVSTTATTATASASTSSPFSLSRPAWLPAFSTKGK